MKKLIILLLLFIIIFTLNCEEIKKINIEDFITESLKSSKFQEILLDELIAQYDESISVPAGDFILSILSEYQLNYNNLLFHRFKGSIGLSKLFSYTGTKLSAEYSIQPTINNNVTSKIQIKIEQDIIKNAFGRITRIKKKLAGYEKQIAYYQVIEAYEDYLTTLINIFIDWYYLYENIKFIEKSLDERNLLLKNTRRRYSYGVALPSDVYKSELQVINKKEELIKLKNSYEILIFQIKYLLSISDPEMILEPDFTPVSEDDTNLQESFDEFKKNSRIANILQLINKNNNLLLKVAVDDILPSAKLYAGYSFEGSGYLFETNQSHLFSAGISFDLDIPQPGFLAKYKKQKKETEKNILNMENTIEDYWIDFNILYNNLMTEKSYINLTDQKIDLSNKILKEELKRYNQGHSSFNDLVLIYDTNDTNRFAKITHLVEFYKHYIEWLRLNDRLVTNDKEVNLK